MKMHLLQDSGDRLDTSFCGTSRLRAERGRRRVGVIGVGEKGGVIQGKVERVKLSEPVDQSDKKKKKWSWWAASDCEWEKWKRHRRPDWAEKARREDDGGDEVIQAHTASDERLSCQSWGGVLGGWAVLFVTVSAAALRKKTNRSDKWEWLIFYQKTIRPVMVKGWSRFLVANLLTFIFYLLLFFALFLLAALLAQSIRDSVLLSPFPLF